MKLKRFEDPNFFIAIGFLVLYYKLFDNMHIKCFIYFIHHDLDNYNIYKLFRGIILQ